MNEIQVLHAQQLGKLVHTEVKLRMFLQLKDERIKRLHAEIRQLKAAARENNKRGKFSSP